MLIANSGKIVAGTLFQLANIMLTKMKQSYKITFKT